MNETEEKTRRDRQMCWCDASGRRDFSSVEFRSLRGIERNERNGRKVIFLVKETVFCHRARDLITSGHRSRCAAQSWPSRSLGLSSGIYRDVISFDVQFPGQKLPFERDEGVRLIDASTMDRRVLEYLPPRARSCFPFPACRLPAKRTR